MLDRIVRKTRKMIALFLCIICIAGLIPVNTLAQETETLQAEETMQAETMPAETETEAPPDDEDLPPETEEADADETAVPQAEDDDTKIPETEVSSSDSSNMEETSAETEVEMTAETSAEETENAEEDKPQCKTYTFEDDQVTITASETMPEIIPDGAELVCRPVDPKSEEYQDLRYDLTELYETTQDAVEIFPYDVSFMIGAQEIEPENGSILLKFDLKEPIKVDPEEQVDVVHIDNDGNTEIVADDVSENNKVETFEVEVDSLSPVVLTRVGVQSAPLKAIRKETEDGEVFISKTSNINENGVATRQYDNRMNVTDTVNADGALKLKVSVTYGGEGINCDWLYIKDANGNILTQDANGKNVGSTASGSQGKIGGKNLDFTGNNSGTTNPANTVTYEFDTDALQFTWRTDGSVTGYGYYAVITPVYPSEPVPDFHFEELEDGTYALVFDKGGDISAFVNRPDIREQIAPYKDHISEIRLHKETKSIINGAFKNLPMLNKVTVPRNSQLTTIGKNAFAGCENLESMTIPPAVTEIDGSAFTGCKSLTTVKFDPANQMTQLPAGLFRSLTALKNVTLPANLTKVPDDCFYGCKALTNIDLPESVTAIGQNAFRETKLSEVPGLDHVTSIGNYAFAFCPNLTKVTIPATVTTLGPAFEGCSGITDFIFEDGTSFPRLGGWFFQGMTKLKNVKLPSDLTAIGTKCFLNCTSLEHVEIPDTVKSIGEEAFSGCTKLVDFEIPAGVTSLGAKVFNGCTSLKDMTIPKTVTSIGSGLFYGCSNLIRAAFEEGSPISTLPSSMFFRCSKLEFVKLPDNVTAIPSSYFYECSSLKHVDMPANLTSIGDSAFYNCYNIEDIELPNTLKTIGSNVFYNCDKLTDVVIPKSVTSIGSSVWQSCDGLRSVVFEEGSPLKSLSTYLFSNCKNLETLVLPTGLTSIPNYLCQGCSKLADVTIPPNVTSIGNSAFASCTALKHIELPDKVKTLSESAFSSSGLTEIELPDSLATIGNYCFSGTKLTEVTIPKNVTNVGSYAFRNNKSLESVTFEEGGKNCTISGNAFYYCPALKDLTLKEGITSIETSAFYNDRRLEEITIPSTVTTIGASAFQNCSSVKKLEFLPSASGKSLSLSTSSSGRVFAGLSAVEEIIIDRNITSAYTVTNIFNDINPKAKFVIGEHVDTLDNLFVSNFNADTEIEFKGENDFKVSTRIANTTEDVKWSELKGDFYVDPNGVVYKLNNTDNTASVFYIPKGLTDYTVPATVTSVAGKTYQVTAIDSYACRSASDLTSLTVEDPASVTIPQFAFSKCPSLETINGKTELYPEEWTDVSLLCDFPVHTDETSEQVLILRDTIELGGGESGEEQKFSFGVSISGQEKMDDDGLTYVYPTGMSARLDFAISNESNMDMSDRVIRVYFAFDGDNYTMGSYVPGQDYTLVNTATGARYPMKVRATDAKGVYYYDITGFRPGDTLAFNNNFAYISPKSAGGTMKVWVESISAEEAAEKEGKTSQPNKYIMGEWYTQPTPYNIQKKVNGSPTFTFAANQDDEDDDNIYARNISYRIDMTSGGSSGNSYAKDYIKYVDFYDDMKLPEGMIWNPEMIEAVRNKQYYYDPDNYYLYVNVNGKWVELCHMGYNDPGCLRSISLETTTDDNGNDAVRIHWAYRNTYWSDAKTAPSAEMPATTYYVYLGNTAVEVKRDSDLWDMLRDGREFPQAESEAMRKVSNKVTETAHYSFSEDQTKEAQAPERMVYLSNGFSMTKSMTGEAYFGKPHGYNINLINSGLTNKDDIDLVEDTLQKHYYLTADSIWSLFHNRKWGPFVHLDITSATLCEIPDRTVTDVNGNTINGFTAQQSGIDPIPYNGLAPDGSDASVITANAKLSFYWNDAHDLLMLDVKNDAGVVQHTYSIGDGGDFASVQDAIDAIGYVVTYNATYKVYWDLDDAYTLYKARQNGVNASTVGELTPEQIEKYEYKLMSGRTDTFNIPSNIKQATMWLSGDKANAYTNTRISSNNYAYAKENTGRQVGSASWSGYLYNDLTLSKSASANGQTWSSNISVPDDTVLDYTLSFTNAGETYDVLPLTDKMGGSQMLLVPVRGNKTALYYPEGETEGITLQDAGLDTYTSSGIVYYILNKDGIYKDITIDGRKADEISVSTSAGSAVTLMTWYFQDVSGRSVNAGSITRSVTYKALADSSRLGDRPDDGNGSTVTASTLKNESWLGGHQTHRLYATISGGSEQMQFSKRIVEDPEAARENLIGHSLIQDGDDVLYKIVIKNVGNAEATLTGNRLRDELPTTRGVFPWTKENVEEIYFVTENLGTSVENDGAEHWSVSSIHPSTGANTAASGQYYIYWDNAFRIHFDPKSEVWMYVRLHFPDADDTDPETGERTNAWDDFIALNSGAQLTNTFYLDGRPSSVTHELVDFVEGKMQKGVLDTGLSKSGYFQSEDTRHYYQNGGNTDNGSVQEVAYYTVLYNSGNVRMYLDKLQDQLPKGFVFRGLINCIPKQVQTSAGTNASSSTYYNMLGSYSSNYNTLYYTEYYANNSNYIPIAKVKDEDRTNISYMNAKVIASTSTDNDGHQQIIFDLSRNTTGTGYLKYDSSLGKYYLDPGEAVRFGYICTVQGYARTENNAFNEISMPVYDKYGLGVHLSENVEIQPATYRDIAVNDGGCDLTTTEEETVGFDHTKPAWVKATTDWFSSNVSLQRLPSIPGVLKTVGGETMIPSTQQIRPDQIYGSKYTDGSKDGSPYTGTVARTSVVNWRIRAYNEGGIGSNSMEDYWIVDTVDPPYQFTGNVFYDYYNVNGTKMTNQSVPVFSLGGRSENDTQVRISTGSGNSTLSLDATITVNGAPVTVDAGRATVQLLRDDTTGAETIKIRFKDNYHRIPPNSYSQIYLHTQYTSNDAVLSKQFYNHVQLEPTTEFDPALVSQGKVLYREENGDIVPYGMESGASVTMTAGYSSAARKQVTELDNGSNTGWSDKTKNYIELPEKYSKFRYDLYVDLPKDDPTSKLVLIDALPEPGDHSAFVDRDKRDSQFVVHMLSEDLGLQVWSSPDLGTGTKKELTTADYQFEVSTRTEFEAEDWDGGGENWSLIDLSDGLSESETALIENARSFRMIIDDEDVVENPNDALMGKNFQVQVRFNAELLHPEEADPGSIAWNSFGYRYTVPIGATGISTSLNAEPLKVGVLIPSVPLVLKDQKTPHNHYKNALTDTQYSFLIYSGSALPQLNDISEMSLADIADVLSSNSRDILYTSLTVSAGSATGKTDFLDEEKKWEWDGSAFVPTETNWIWHNAQKYTILELPWEDNGYEFSNIQHSPVNNYTFVQTSENNVQLRVTNVYGRKGNLKLQKTVNGPSFDPERKFTFTITLKDGKYPAFGTYNYTGTNMRDGTLTFDDTGKAIIQLKHGQAIEIRDIPEDYTYSITEAADTLYTASSSNESGTIVHDATQTAAFVNTRKDTSLSVTKTVRGNMGNRKDFFDFEVYIIDEGRELSGEYPVTIQREGGTTTTTTATFVEGAYEFQLSHGDVVTFSGLPVGARFELDERANSRKGYTVSAENEAGILTEAPVSSSWTNTRWVYLPLGHTQSMTWPAIGIGICVLGAVCIRFRKKRQH